MSGSSAKKHLTAYLDKLTWRFKPLNLPFDDF